MAAIKTILHATDFSENAQLALSIAGSLARDYDARLILLHVRPNEMGPASEFGPITQDGDETDATIEARLQALAPPADLPRAEYWVRRGEAADEIVKAAAECGCDMIVLGTHGRSGLARFFMGSVSESVLRRATCPVLTIRLVTLDEIEPEANELETVATVTLEAQAQVIRNALESEGIRAFIEGGSQAGLVGTMGIPVKVQVRARDHERAIQILEAHEPATP